MDCMVQMRGTNGDMLEIHYGEYIEYSKYGTRESGAFWWDEMDLSKHGEIASWPVWEGSWVSFEALVATFKRYERSGGRYVVAVDIKMHAGRVSIGYPSLSL